MNRVPGSASTLCALALVSGALAGCDDNLPSEQSFYSERIGPAFQVGCVQQTTGCHLASDTGTATGNLDLSSFDALMRRDDALPAFGPYPVGLLLLKGGPEQTVSVQTFDPHPGTGERFVSFDTDIRHNAGSGIAFDSQAFRDVQEWISEGFTRTGGTPDEISTSLGACNPELGEAHGFDPSAEPAAPELFDAFLEDVQPVLRESCAGAQCHGNPIADLYLSCGDTAEQLRWNYFVSLAHLTTPVSTSELLRRPLSSFRGGSFHEGGNVFANTSDEAYQRLFDWAERVAMEREDLIVPDTSEMSDGLRFFANRVQPALVRKGCMFMNCHSPSMFHDLRLRTGSNGVFSEIATRHNYEMSLHQLATESPDPNESRIIAKNLFPRTSSTAGEGILHRGGSLFEDFGTDGARLNPATPDDCEGVDADAGPLSEVPAYCILARWHEIERQEAIERGELTAEPLSSVVWVERPTGVGDVRDFDTFRGNADLVSAPATVADDGALSLGAATSLLGGCGIPAGADIRSPAVAWDGSRVAFAARPTAADPLRLYWMAPDGSGCEPIPGIAPGTDQESGILTHDFDPAFAPDGRIVFASTRGNMAGRDYGGPTRTPAAMQPNANLYIYEPDGASVRQLTFLLNQELAPSFMADGRVIFTAEKREPGFHQLALRRQNLDGGDYHPLFAQRGSVGFASATEVVELPNRNLAFVAAPLGTTDSAGTLMVVNRSIGPDQDDRDPGDRAYLHSMSLPSPGAFGTIQDVPVGQSTDRGVFRSPAALPTGRVLASCVPNATDLRGGPFAFQLCELDPETGNVRVIGGADGRANVEAVAVYPRPNEGVFESRIDEANGTTRIEAGASDAVVHILDFPLLESLLFVNTRTGIDIDPEVGGLRVFEVRPPPADATTFADVSANVVEDDLGRVFTDYVDLGAVPINGDGSVKIQVPGGVPVLLGVTDAGGELLSFEEGDPFQGERMQKEQMQFYPGERINQSFPRKFFNSLCGGCHGSITNRELDVAPDVDVLTSASRTQAWDQAPADLR